MTTIFFASLTPSIEPIHGRDHEPTTVAPACRHRRDTRVQMDGSEYTQSTALLRYTGKLGDIYPEDPLTAVKVIIIARLFVVLEGRCCSC